MGQHMSKNPTGLDPLDPLDRQPQEFPDDPELANTSLGNG